MGEVHCPLTFFTYWVALIQKRAVNRSRIIGGSQGNSINFLWGSIFNVFLFCTGIGSYNNKKNVNLASRQDAF